MIRPAALGLAVEERSWLAMELIEALEAAACEAGISCRRVHNGAGEAAVGHLVAIGHPWMYPDLRHRPRRARRTLWYGEWLPPMPTPPADRSSPWRWMPRGRHVDAAARGAIDSLLSMTDGRVPGVSRRLLGLKERAAIEREGQRHLEELAADAHVFDDVVVTSHDKAAGAARAGVAARVVPYGYQVGLCGPIVDPTTTREVPALFLGGLATSGFRRGRILSTLERTAPFPIQAVHAGLHGAERHARLRQVRVVLDIHRVPGNMAALRWLHAVAAGAVLVTEPFLDPRPLQPGVHFVQAAEADLGASMAEILHDEPRRQAIVTAAQALLRGPLSMRTSLDRLLGDIRTT